jgi:hypothetical protein
MGIGSWPSWRPSLLLSKIDYRSKRKLPSLPLRLCRIRRPGTNVILSGSEESRISLQLRKADPSAEFTLSIAEGPQDDIAAQSLAKGGNLNSSSGDYGHWSSAA